MPNLKNLGTCKRCGESVLSVRAVKDHTIGQPSHGTVLMRGAYKEKMKFGAA